MAFLFALLLANAHAEYRAFELVINDPKTGQTSVVLSSLEPKMYRRYYAVTMQSQVYYRATWMCRGNTSFYEPVCPRPERKN